MEMVFLKSSKNAKINDAPVARSWAIAAEDSPVGWPQFHGPFQAVGDPKRSENSADRSVSETKMRLRCRNKAATKQDTLKRPRGREDNSRQKTRSPPVWQPWELQGRTSATVRLAMERASYAPGAPLARDHLDICSDNSRSTEWFMDDTRDGEHQRTIRSRTNCRQVALPAMLSIGWESYRNFLAWVKLFWPVAIA